MPIFTRRQLQLQLDELAPCLTSSKARDLIRRLENRNPDQSLPAEYELALLSGVSKVANLEIDRQTGSRTPDIFSSDLFPSGPAAIEVAAISDAALSGETVMRRAANIILNYCNSVRRGSERHLFFIFGEERGYVPDRRPGLRQSRFFRRRKIDGNFELDDQTKLMLRSWLKSAQNAGPLRIQNQKYDIIIEWKVSVHPPSNFFCTMPSVAHDIVDNPLYRVLDSKRGQLASVANGVKRCIFLGDAGCSLLRDPNRRWSQTFSGADIIRSFLADSTSVDLVCVFAPRCVNENSLYIWNNPRLWHLYIFDRRETSPNNEFDKLNALQKSLPPPYLHGYQARSWHQQRLFEPQARGHYLPSQLTTGLHEMTARISARGLQELIAGRITREEFHRWVLGKLDPFEIALRNGEAIVDVRFQSAGTDSDDDYIEFAFAVDPNASALRIPANLKSDIKS